MAKKKVTSAKRKTANKKVVGKKKAALEKKGAGKEKSDGKKNKAPPSEFANITEQALNTIQNASPENEISNNENNKEEVAEGIVRLEGEMTIYTAAELKQKLSEWINDNAIHGLDLSDVTEMDSSGFQLLLAIRHEKINNGEKFDFVSFSPAVMEVLNLYQVTDYLKAS